MINFAIVSLQVLWVLFVIEDATPDLLKDLGVAGISRCSMVG